MNDRQLLATAYHEAGHAVARHTLGFQVDSITIEKNGCRDGLERGSNPLCGLDLSADPDPRERDLAERAVMIWLAGAVAQIRFDPGCYEASHAGDDHERALEVVSSYLCRDPDCTQSTLLRLEGLTERLVTDRWTCVERLAEALLARRTLSGPDVSALIGDLRRFVRTPD